MDINKVYLGDCLETHGDECDIDGAIDTIAEGVLKIAEKLSASCCNKEWIWGGGEG